MQLKDILSPEEIAQYHKEWGNFRGKYKLNYSYNVHSGMPVISEVYQFENRPVFRAHVFQKRLRKFDPYFISAKHIFPMWHIIHYFIVLEQMYHASMRLIRDTDKFRTLETPLEFSLSSSIFWSENISVEMILESKRQTKKYLIEDCFFTLYEEESNKIRNRFSARTFTEPRPYVMSMEKIKQGDKKEVENLIKLIESRKYSQSNLLKQRQNLPNKDYLIEQLKSGQIPEAELHDFFSFWDKPQS